ncbi:uncharacterized protein L969DRAFT_47591 [Mixia osmundae IAM 14324]|uniref:Uncharacterized protein n=1 Tax=Mixia osmundae (strain CBS 9802 / IAM 14324 / JCM 22182 / KY 12970) TaxID=764103 RepID=G7E8M6_MIXOS|nr:uncharacterized protein L969DRAFT_47591 [Mixia osmundae IAM 14324]KEI40128.1 hypothetical protein L969DRAFT_47591 [Mixia osmundae IAM 14324]GAA99494.1 hypothetical protein E5Q_06194 [Mixia osmundae IAM 14324]
MSGYVRSIVRAQGTLKTAASSSAAARRSSWTSISTFFNRPQWDVSGAPAPTRAWPSSALHTRSRATLAQPSNLSDELGGHDGSLSAMVPKRLPQRPSGGTAVREMSPIYRAIDTLNAYGTARSSLDDMSAIGAYCLIRDQPEHQETIKLVSNRALVRLAHCLTVRIQDDALLQDIVADLLRPAELAETQALVQMLQSYLPDWQRAMQARHGSDLKASQRLAPLILNRWDSLWRRRRERSADSLNLEDVEMIVAASTQSERPMSTLSSDDAHEAAKALWDRAAVLLLLQPKGANSRLYLRWLSALVPGAFSSSEERVQLPLRMYLFFARHGYVDDGLLTSAIEDLTNSHTTLAKSAVYGFALWRAEMRLSLQKGYLRRALPVMIKYERQRRRLGLPIDSEISSCLRELYDASCGLTGREGFDLTARTILCLLENRIQVSPAEVPYFLGERGIDRFFDLATARQKVLQRAQIDMVELTSHLLMTRSLWRPKPQHLLLLAQIAPHPRTRQLVTVLLPKMLQAAQDGQNLITYDELVTVAFQRRLIDANAFFVRLDGQKTKFSSHVCAILIDALPASSERILGSFLNGREDLAAAISSKESGGTAKLSRVPLSDLTMLLYGYALTGQRTKARRVLHLQQQLRLVPDVAHFNATLYFVARHSPRAANEMLAEAEAFGFKSDSDTRATLKHAVQANGPVLSLPYASGMQA